MSISPLDYQQIRLPEFKNAERQQQIKLLNSILLLLIPITLFFSIFNVMVMSNFEQLLELSIFLDALVGLSVLLVVYIINRMGYYRIAVWALIFFSGSTVTVHVLQSSPPHLEMTHYILLLLIAKSLLSKLELFVTTFITLICIIFVSLVIDTISIFAAWNIGAFIVVIYFLLRVVSSYREALERGRRELVQSSEIRLRALLDQVPALVWVIDQNMSVESFNGSQQDLIKEFESYLVEICQHHANQFKSQSVIIFDHQWNGRYYSNTIRPQTDSHNKVTGYLGTTIDITERKTNEFKTLELVKQKERHDIATEFLNNASHDFRTPLSVLSTSTYLLKHCDEADRLRHLDKLELSVKRLQKMVDDMFYIIKLDTQPSKMQILPVNEILRDIISRYNEKNHQHGRVFKAKIECTDQCTIIGETSYLDRAISNILDNAFQYTSDNDIVKLSIQNVGTDIQITIINHGPQIPSSHLPQIYNHFFRGEEHRSLDNNNIGLGLTITQKIIELHQGTIHTESLDDVGVKTVITIPNESMRKMQAIDATD